MPNKEIVLQDANNTIDNIANKAGLRTEIRFYKLGTKELILPPQHNKVLIAGSQLLAMKEFGLAEKVALPTYNTALGLQNSETSESGTSVCCLFCCGTQGCASESSTPSPVRYTGRISPTNDIIPFQYPLTGNDLSAEERAKYFGRKEIKNSSGVTERYAYYFKAFETDPVLKLQYTDGTAITETLYDSTPTDDAETFVEMTLRITKDDFRDYYRAADQLSSAKINSIGLCTAWYKEESGYKWFQHIRPFTQLNIPNEPLVDLTKGIDITYHIYF